MPFRSALIAHTGLGFAGPLSIEYPRSTLALGISLTPTHYLLLTAAVSLTSFSGSTVWV